MHRSMNVLIGTFAILYVGIAGAIFAVPPTKKAADESPRLIKLLAPKFEPLPKPQPGDWLDQHKEKGQTYREYRAQHKKPICERFPEIDLLPLGGFTEPQDRLIQQTAEFMEAYFGMKVNVLDRLPLDDVPNEAQRPRKEGASRQLLTGFLLKDVLKPRRSEKAAALLGFVSEDLWPGEGWNYVFGQASLNERVGVWSLYRNGDPEGDEDEARLCLTRTLKTAVHETGHMFGIPHCLAYACCMNGANHLEESDRKPIECCPECQAKLWFTCKVAPRERYRRLIAFCDDAGLDEFAEFWRELDAVLSDQ